MSAAHSPAAHAAQSRFSDDARADAPLGTLLFRAGLVPDEELRDALEYAKDHSRRLGEVLHERGLVSEFDLSRILASQKGLEFVDVRETRPDPAAVSLLPEEGALEWGALVLAVEDDRPVVAVTDPGNRYVFGRVTEALGRKPRFVGAVPSDLARAIVSAYERLRTLEIEVAPVAEDVLRAPAGTATAQVVILMTNGERVPVSLPATRGEALAEARALILAIDERAPGGWPLAGGRYLRPDAIVSVDVVDAPPA